MNSNRNKTKIISQFQRGSENFDPKSNIKKATILYVLKLRLKYSLSLGFRFSLSVTLTLARHSTPIGSPSGETSENEQFSILLSMPKWKSAQTMKLKREKARNSEKKAPQRNKSNHNKLSCFGTPSWLNTLGVGNGGTLQQRGCCCCFAVFIKQPILMTLSNVSTCVSKAIWSSSSLRSLAICMFHGNHQTWRKTKIKCSIMKKKKTLHSDELLSVRVECVHECLFFCCSLSFISLGEPEDLNNNKNCEVWSARKRSNNG